MSSARFDTAIYLHQAGQLQQAEELYRQILEAEPQHVNALYLSGVIALQTGRAEAGVVAIAEAVRLRPDFAEAHLNLAHGLKHLCRWDEALVHYRRAVDLMPNSAPVRHHLAVLLTDRSEFDQAFAILEQVIVLDPDHADAHCTLGNVQIRLRRCEDALASYRAALRIQPNRPDACNGVANAFRELGDLEQAGSCLRETLLQHPHFCVGHLNLGELLFVQGRLAEARACFDEAVRQGPDNATAHWVRSMFLLSLGEYEEGWREYEWRWQTKNVIWPGLMQPVWDGRAFSGQTVLLWCEQGLGDSIQFVRYAPLVKARGGRVILLCPEKLMGILSTCPGIDEVTSQDAALPAFDMHASLMSLPRILRTRVDSIPGRTPYLFAEPARVARWRQELIASAAKFRIGVAWQGNPKNHHDRQRSFAIENFAALARLPNVQLLNLQFGSQPTLPNVVDLGPRLGEFAETAAVIANLNLVITCDSMPAHLAGALGVPVWVALSALCDWRWLCSRDDSPWYRTARLFRQKRLGDWSDVFARITAAATQAATVS